MYIIKADKLYVADNMLCYNHFNFSKFANIFKFYEIWFEFDTEILCYKTNFFVFKIDTLEWLFSFAYKIIVRRKNLLNI